jgi:Nuclease-related domain
MTAMQVITPRTARRGPTRGSVAVGTTVGAILFFGGLTVAWLAFGTPFISRFTPATARPEMTQMIAGMLAWSFALIAPATFIIAGVARIAAVIDSVSSARPRPSATAQLASLLGDEYVVVTRVRLPDGRMIPELVLGPYGVAVIEELPPVAATRRRGDAWEVRTSDGKWMPYENPLERASRDAERVRRWFAQDDHDFVVKVYAAVVAPDTTLPRTPTCAVITKDQIPAWLGSLPAQRSLTPGRRQRLVEVISSAG